MSEGAKRVWSDTETVGDWNYQVEVWAQGDVYSWMLTKFRSDTSAGPAGPIGGGPADLLEDAKRDAKQARRDAIAGGTR